MGYGGDNSVSTPDTPKCAQQQGRWRGDVDLNQLWIQSGQGQFQFLSQLESLKSGQLSPHEYMVRFLTPGLAEGWPLELPLDGGEVLRKGGSRASSTQAINPKT